MNVRLLSSNPSGSNLTLGILMTGLEHSRINETRLLRLLFEWFILKNNNKVIINPNFPIKSGGKKGIVVIYINIPLAQNLRLTIKYIKGLATF